MFLHVEYLPRIDTIYRNVSALPMSRRQEARKPVLSLVQMDLRNDRSFIPLPVQDNLHHILDTILPLCDTSTSTHVYIYDGIESTKHLFSRPKTVYTREIRCPPESYMVEAIQCLWLCSFCCPCNKTSNRNYPHKYHYSGNRQRIAYGIFHFRTITLLPFWAFQITVCTMQ